MSEIEELSQAYEEVQSKNDELRQTVSLKEEALARAKSDKLRSDHAATMFKAEHEKLHEKADKLSKQADALQTLKASYEQQLRKATAAAAKKDDELRAYEALLASHKAQLKETQYQAQQATMVLQATQEAEQRAKEREDKASVQLAAEGAKVKRLTQERDSLTRKLSRAGKEAAEAAAGGGSKNGSGDSDLLLETFRRKVKCSLCRINDKDCVINKCFHAFCRDCIQQRLDVRNRKCPACALQFDYQSVKDLFLTS